MTNNIATPSTSVVGFDQNLVRYGSIFLLVVGTFGNIISFIIFLNGALRKSSTFRYLALLSIMDLLVLYSGLLDLFLVVHYGGTFSIRSLHPVACRMHTFITYWSQHSSSWILSFISVDRAIATNCIKFARKFCTPRSAEYIVGIILCFTALINSHELIFLRLQDANNNGSRDSSSSSLSYQFNISAHESLMSYGFDSDVKTLNKRSVTSLLSICDNPQLNFLCSRAKRDIHVSNSTTAKHLLKAKIPLKRCEPLQDSGYEHFWDHVSHTFCFSYCLFFLLKENKKYH